MSDNLQDIRPNILAKTEAEAESKFNWFKAKDPFPSIFPALLSSADIFDYVAATGMIYPFDHKNLKSASYEIPLEGRIFYWDGENKDHSQDIGEGSTFTLPKNSIAFINLKAHFRIPDYIALRFNLRITNVHKGLLLGTGPLIDPGFDGKLLIPLHNLTSNDYILNGEEGFIWVEFTKLNLINEWKSENDYYQRRGQYVSFPDSKKNKDAQYYFGKAAFGTNIKSSIPEIIIKSEKAADESSKNAKDAKKRVTLQFWVTVIALMAVIVPIGIAIPQVVSIIDTNSKIINETKYELKERIKILEKNDTNNDLKKRIEILEKKVNNFKKPQR